MSRGETFDPEIRAAAREAYIAAIVGKRKSPQRDARRAVGVVSLRTISNWAREWDRDPDVKQAVHARTQSMIRRVEHQSADLVDDVHSLAKKEPTIESDFGMSTRKVPNPAIEAKALAARTAIGLLSTLQRVSERSDQPDMGSGDDEPTPQKAAALVRQKFGHVAVEVSAAVTVEQPPKPDDAKPDDGDKP